MNRNMGARPDRHASCRLRAPQASSWSFGRAPTTGQRTAAARSPAPQVPAAPAGVTSYFIVNNVYKVKPEFAADFEETWRTRNSHLKEMPGFVRFAMLRCSNVAGKYVSQTTWADKASFENWTTSSQFQASHGGGSKAGGQASKRPPVMAMLEGPPAPEFFETVTVTEL